MPTIQKDPKSDLYFVQIYQRIDTKHMKGAEGGGVGDHGTMRILT